MTFFESIVSHRMICGCSSCISSLSSGLFNVTVTVLNETQLLVSDWLCCCAPSLPSRGSCPTSRLSQTWGDWTRSGYSWWSGGSCSFWALQDASEHSGKTLSCSSLYVPDLRFTQCSDEEAWQTSYLWIILCLLLLSCCSSLCFWESSFSWSSRQESWHLSLRTGLKTNSTCSSTITSGRIETTSIYRTS